METVVTMEEFVARALLLADNGFPDTESQELLDSTKIEPESLKQYSCWKPGFYARSLVHKDPRFELLIVCWDKGQAAPIHGHEGERCWVRVETGKLLFRNYKEEQREGDYAKLVPDGDPIEGGAGFVDGPSHLHSVENPAEFDERAVSLHLYSYPFGKCDIYDADKDQVSQVELRYDAVGGQVLDEKASALELGEHACQSVSSHLRSKKK